MSSYQAIARKWRPATFEEISGQGHVTRTLQNALRLGRIHHAFLFTGARGVGKTTAARTLARALNCKEGPTPTPCGECASCTEIVAGNSSARRRGVVASGRTTCERVTGRGSFSTRFRRRSFSFSPSRATGRPLP